MKAENLFRPLVFVFSIASMMSCGTSCGMFLGDMKHDADDSEGRQSPQSAQNSRPFADDASTTGGNWPERGYLESEDEEKGRGLAAERQDRDSVSSSENERKLYKYGSRATRDDFVDQSQEEGSLWASGGQTNYYFTKNKIRSPGDIVTMVIENDVYRDIGIEVKQKLSPREKAAEVKLIRDQLRTRYLASIDPKRTEKGASEKDTLATSAAAPEPAAATPGNTPATTPAGATPPAEVQAAPSRTPQVMPMTQMDFEKKMAMISMDDVDIYPLLSLKAGDTMLGEIIGRYPNGNYKVRTVKRIPYKHGPPRMVSVVGVVKSSDINEDTDTVSSGKLYEYRIEVAH